MTTYKFSVPCGHRTVTANDIDDACEKLFITDYKVKKRGKNFEVKLNNCSCGHEKTYFVETTTN